MNTINKLFSQLSFNPSQKPLATSSEKQDYNERYFRQRYIDAIQKIANVRNISLAKENKYYKFEFSEPDFKLKDMNVAYSYEKVTYFTKEGLEERQVLDG